MNFGQGSSGFTIKNGKFNNIGGDYTVYNGRGYEPNNNWGDTHNDRMDDSNNGSSKSFRGQSPRSPPARDSREEWIPYSPATDNRGEGAYAGPSPQRQQFTPQQASFQGGNVTNSNSFNVDNTRVDDVSNDYSETYHYDRRAPPQRRGSDRPQERPVQPKSRSHTLGVHSSPPRMVDSPPIQRMDQNTRDAHERAMKQTQAWIQENDRSGMAGNMDENYEADHSDASSHSVEVQDPMSADMANLSIGDQMPPHRSSDNSHPHFATYISPPPIMTRGNSEPQNLTTPQRDYEMGSSDFRPDALQHSNSAPTPSVAPQMNEPVMVDDPLVDTSGKTKKRKRDVVKGWLSRKDRN